jgi:hypothetical protein
MSSSKVADNSFLLTIDAPTRSGASASARSASIA